MKFLLLVFNLFIFQCSFSQAEEDVFKKIGEERGFGCSVGMIQYLGMSGASKKGFQPNILHHACLRLPDLLQVFL